MCLVLPGPPLLDGGLVALVGAALAEVEGDGLDDGWSHCSVGLGWGAWFVVVGSWVTGWPKGLLHLLMTRSQVRTLPLGRSDQDTAPPIFGVDPTPHPTLPSIQPGRRSYHGRQVRLLCLPEQQWVSIRYPDGSKKKSG